ncbi:basic proline-rich protein-like [Varanus komodoensis]|uniref:basic proline-rich protein-like n=1 Tax=Varanus komodoensis TaxID=61221 RepID=UPI001CF7DFB5|nr:basic proline-rich protein-like [Varanus komodoensis]
MGEPVSPAPTNPRPSPALPRAAAESAETAGRSRAAGAGAGPVESGQRQQPPPKLGGGAQIAGGEPKGSERLPAEGRLRSSPLQPAGFIPPLASWPSPPCIYFGFFPCLPCNYLKQQRRGEDTQGPSRSRSLERLPPGLREVILPPPPQRARYSASRTSRARPRAPRRRNRASVRAASRAGAPEERAGGRGSAPAWRNAAPRAGRWLSPAAAPRPGWKPRGRRRRPGFPAQLPAWPAPEGRQPRTERRRAAATRSPPAPPAPLQQTLRRATRVRPPRPGRVPASSLACEATPPASVPAVTQPAGGSPRLPRASGGRPFPRLAGWLARTAARPPLARTQPSGSSAALPGFPPPPALRTCAAIPHLSPLGCSTSPKVKISSSVTVQWGGFHKGVVDLSGDSVGFYSHTRSDLVISPFHDYIQ